MRHLVFVLPLPDLKIMLYTASHLVLNPQARAVKG